MASILPCFGRFGEGWENPWKSDRITAFGRSEAGKGGAEKLRSKMVQVKGVMPLEGGLTHQTPTGRAVGKIYGWHNISGIFGKVMPSFIFIGDYKAEKERIFMSCRQIWEEHHI
jgi:hypothetical protein